MNAKLTRILSFVLLLSIGSNGIMFAMDPAAAPLLGQQNPQQPQNPQQNPQQDPQQNPQQNPQGPQQNPQQNPQNPNPDAKGWMKNLKNLGWFLVDPVKWEKKGHGVFKEYPWLTRIALPVSGFAFFALIATNERVQKSAKSAASLIGFTKSENHEADEEDEF